MRSRILLFLFACITTSYLKAGDSIPDVSAEELSAHVSFLASDKLKGRAAGTQENIIAAGYIAAQFALYHLQPLPSGNYYDTIPQFSGDLYPSCNVIGVLPGKSRPEEHLLISAHFDHVPEKNGQVYNGANDNASGVAAMLALLRCFAEQGGAERTIVFCAFNMEERGLVGSTHFADVSYAEKRVAVINLEMLGIPQKRKAQFFMTGTRFSDLAALLRKGLAGTGVSLAKEKGDLFMRSDNYPFYLQGTPAHTLMAATDFSRCYHRPCDDIGNLDLKNMALIVNAIFKAFRPLAAGTETPVLTKKN
ncbi:M20/M25/M40 family metallo-hydrolase [Flavihumibacter petaseus]|uniref:Peptidase M28 family protein n=1 Tax=Flavihumibacter petaseus NBRC 106054 TaxID=1220578 RepID=A0A0E9MX80_9BACT|nr:M20/M25/M40 family metallo-hydrolase [Flavihumibacter petaseus]GAO41725.1 peptidase M28 family protein [Flavihumibacter petaseus NBRC 106054]